MWKFLATSFLIISFVIMLTIPRHAVAASGYLIALVSGGAILFNESTGDIIHCTSVENANGPSTGACVDVGAVAGFSLSGGTFSIAASGAKAYITNLSTGNVVRCSVYGAIPADGECSCGLIR